MADGLWRMGSGRWAVGGGCGRWDRRWLWVVGGDWWEVTGGRWAVEDDRWEVTDGRREVTSGRWEVGNGS